MRYEEQNCNTLIATRPLTGERSIMLTVHVCLSVCVLAGISPLTRPVETGPLKTASFHLNTAYFFTNIEGNTLKYLSLACYS